jgi:ethanolamine utilization protein EutA
VHDEKILTVGIDLGTSTTQLVISELTIQNFASTFTVPRISISDKKILYQSEILFTPLLNQTEIDGERIRDFVEEQYKKSHTHKEEIQMGAVIITGESARKKNANNVLEALSSFAGDFVVATAGPDLESIIAGKGAGTHLLSKEHAGVLVNIDVGGGTSNLAAFRTGEVVGTACFDVGGRLIRLHPKTKVVEYISPKVKEMIERKGFSIREGKVTTVAELQKISDELTKILENSIGLGTRSEFYEIFITNHVLSSTEDIQGITFSGGVASCMLEKEENDVLRYGDIGVLLARSILNSAICREKTILPSQETIRATVVGAGSHTTEVSGSTIAYKEKVLPIKNLPIVKMSEEDEQVSEEGFAKLISEKIQWQVFEDELPNVALAIKGVSNPSFNEIQQYARSIVKGMKEILKKEYPMIVMVEHDMAKALGHSLFSLLPSNYPFVCIDSVKVENGDYIDIGNPIAGGQVLPVIVKTLFFC